MQLRGVLRDRGAGRAVPVTNVELFFDLVYVLAIIELSDHLYHDLSWSGALETLVMFAAVWWGWMYTAWATGWIDPERPLVAVLIAILTLLGVLMASAIPLGFKGHGDTFAWAYVAMQVLRGIFMVLAFAKGSTMRRNYAHLLVWSLISGVLWIAGAMVQDPHTRLVIWACAAAIDLSAPIHGFWLPGFGSAPVSGWSFTGAHLAERCQLVLMIAFGETLLRLGESYGATKADDWVNVSLVFGFLMSISLWSIYFLHHAPAAENRIASATKQEARQMRESAYWTSYAHMLMVGSVILMAVAIHLTIEDPTDHVTLAFTLLCTGGPFLYLIGLGLATHSLGLGHGRITPTLVAALLMLATAVLSHLTERDVEMVITSAIAITLAVVTQLGERRRRIAPG